MICIEIRDLMSNYIDGELNDFDKTRVEKHCGECPFCREELYTLKNIVSDTRNMDEYDVPDDLRDNIRNEIMKKSIWEIIKEAFTTVPSFRWQTAGVVLSAFLILIVFAGNMEEVINNGLMEKISTDKITIKNNKMLKGNANIGKAKVTKKITYKIKQNKIAGTYRKMHRERIETPGILSEKTSLESKKDNLEKNFSLLRSSIKDKDIVKSPEVKKEEGITVITGSSFKEKADIEGKDVTALKTKLGNKAKEIPSLNKNIIVTGKVLADKNGKKVGVKNAKVVVVLKDGATKNIQNIVTDKKGNFSLILNKSEKYEINVEKKGYKSKTITNVDESNYQDNEEIVIEK